MSTKIEIKKIVIIVVLIVIILLFAAVTINLILSDGRIFSLAEKQKMLEYDETTIRITKKIKGTQGDYINIVLIIEDEEYGIKEIVKPEGLVITGNNKTKIAIDYKVEKEKDYIFKITNGEGKVKNAIINVEIPKIYWTGETRNEICNRKWNTNRSIYNNKWRRIKISSK